MLGFKASDIGRLPRKPGLATLAKAAAAVAVASLAFVIIPYSAAFAAAVIPRLSVALRPLLAPPFLFAAVHLIILIIWKLSENKKHTDQQDPLTDKLGDLVPSPETNINASLPVSDSIMVDSEVRMPEFNESVYILKKTDLKVQESPDMTDSRNKHMREDGDSYEIKKSAMLTVYSIQSMTEENEVTFEAEDDDSIAGRLKVIIDEDDDDDDSMDARWKAILQGGAAPVEKFMLPEGVTTGGGMQREVSEDCNQKFEAFIKKNYEQIRVAAKLGDG